MTKYYGVELVVSETMRDLDLDGFEFQELDKVRVMGKEKPVMLYTCRKSESFTGSEKQSWHQGLEMYKKGSFAEAVGLFQDMQAEELKIQLTRRFVVRKRGMPK